MKSATTDILQQGGHEDKGNLARIQCYVGAIAIGDMIKSTLGPRGRDKILQVLSNDASRGESTSITNDGATILNRVYIDNPAARILVDISKRQDQECGDGTTGVVVLTAELLRKAEKLIEHKIHPQLIISGFQMALEIALEVLHKHAIKTTEDASEFKNYLIKLGMTTLSSKLLQSNKHHFSTIATNAVLKLKHPNHINLIHIIKKLGSSADKSFLEDGLLLEKSFSKSNVKAINNPKVLVVNTNLDTDKVKIFGAKVTANDYEQIAEIQDAEKQKMKNKIEKIAKSGCNVLVNRQLIYDYPLELLHERGIVCIQNADFDGIERVAAALNAKIISNFDDFDESYIGHCECIEEIVMAEDSLIRFRGCPQSGASTVVLRGASKHQLDEAERSLHDCISIISQTVQDPALVYGGGYIEVAIAEEIMKMSFEVAGKKRLALEAFAEALLEIPTILASNGGYDAAEIVTQMRAAYFKHTIEFPCLDVNNGAVGCAKTLEILESFKSKKNQLILATETAQQIIRVDDVIVCAPKASG